MHRKNIQEAIIGERTNLGVKGSIRKKYYWIICSTYGLEPSRHIGEGSAWPRGLSRILASGEADRGLMSSINLSDVITGLLIASCMSSFRIDIQNPMR